MRYILNKIDSRDKIIDGDIYDNDKFEDYFNEYHEYNKNSFSNISHYLTSLFKNNNLDLKKHYENILIKGTKNLKGIYIEKCKNISTVKKSASERVSERLNNKCNVVEFCVDGLGTPKVVLSKLLYENSERIQLLISDNYFCGSICCFPSQEKNMRTIVYLVNKES